PRGQGAPLAGVESHHTKKPELPTSFVFTCIHSNSQMKFSYIFSVRRKPSGLPVVMISSPLTVNVSGLVLTFTQPLRSLPLNSDAKPSLSFSLSSPATGSTPARPILRQMMKRLRYFM